MKKKFLISTLTLLAIPAATIVSCSTQQKIHNENNDTNKEKPIVPNDSFIANLPDNLEYFYKTQIKKIPRNIASNMSQEDLLKQLDLLKGQYEREVLSQVKIDYSSEISKLSQFIKDENLKNSYLKYFMNPVFTNTGSIYPGQVFYLKNTFSDVKMSYGLDNRDFDSDLVSWKVFPDTSMYQYHTMSSYSMSKNDIVNNWVQEVGTKKDYKDPNKSYVIYSTPIKYIKSYHDINLVPKVNKIYEVYSKNKDRKIILNDTLLINPEIINHISGKEDFKADTTKFVYSFDISFIYDNQTKVDSATLELGKIKLNNEEFTIFQTPIENTVERIIDFKDNVNPIEIISKGQIFDFDKLRDQIDKLKDSKDKKLKELYSLVTGDTDNNPSTIEVNHFQLKNYRDLIPDSLKVDSDDSLNQNILSKALVKTCTDGDTFRDLYHKKNGDTELKTGVSIRIAGFDTPEKKGAPYRFGDNWLQYYMGQYATEECQKILENSEKDLTDPTLRVFYIYRNGLDRYSRQLGYVLKSDYTSYVAEMVANGAGVAATIENEPWFEKNTDFYGFKEEIVYAQLYAAYNRKGIFSQEEWNKANDWIKTQKMKDSSGKDINVPIKSDSYRDYKEDLWYKAPSNNKIHLGLIYPSGRSWSSQHFGFAHPYLNEELIELIKNY